MSLMLFTAQSANGDIDVYEFNGSTYTDLTTGVTGGIGDFVVEPTVLVDGGDPGAYPLLFAFGDDIFFQGDANGDGSNLWVEDAATNTLTDIKPSNAWSSGLTPDDFVAYDGEVYFAGVDAGGPGQLTRPAPTLWASNGTLAGTREVETGVADAGSMAVFDGSLYFNGNDGDGNDDLYAYTGANGAIAEVGPAGLDPIYVTPAITNVLLVGISDDLFLNGADSSGNRGLFVYDGAKLTELTKGNVDPTDIVEMTTDFASANVAIDSSEIYFAGLDSGGGVGLWSATYQGATELVKPTFGDSAGALGLDPRDLTPLNGLLYFIGDDSVTPDGDGSGLFVYDPRTRQTTELIESSAYNLDPDFATTQRGEATPASLTTYGGELFFNAFSPNNIPDLYEYFPSSQTVSVIAVGNWKDAEFEGGADPDALINTAGSDDFYSGGGLRFTLTGAYGEPLALSFTQGDADSVTGANGAIFLTSAQVDVAGGDDTIFFSAGSGNLAELSGTAGVWDTLYGSGGAIDLADAQASVFGGGDALALSGTSGDAASLYSTNNVWDSVSGTGATVYFTDAQASVFGGGDALDLLGTSGDAASLYATNGNWDSVSGSDATLYFTKAQASVTGGGDTLDLLGTSGDAASLYATSNVWDTALGSGATIYFTDARASVFGGGDVLYLLGTSGDAASLYATKNDWDTALGSGATLYFTDAQASVFGGGDALDLLGTSGDAVSLYATNGNWDTATGSDATLYFTDAQASVIGHGDTLDFFSSGNAANLAGTDGVWDTINGANATLGFYGAQASVIGGGDVLNLFDSGDAANLAGTGGVWDTIDGANAALGLYGAQASLVGAGDTIALHGTSSLGFQARYGVDTINGFAATDALQFAAADHGDLVIAQSGANVTVARDAGDVLTLTNATVASVSAAIHYG